MLQPGDIIDNWVVEKPLGSGGMGSVYRCRNRSASRILAAVKVLEEHSRASASSRARFVREAEILFQLDHPNIVKVRNVRTDSTPAYLEMEFVEGEAIESILTRGPMPTGLAIDVMEQAAAAVAYLHGLGIWHRDIKPANLLLQQDGRLKLVDFGLALEAETDRLTQDGMSFGTVSYAPPEWISPEALQPAKWDIYALGVVFWELLTGDLAFPASDEGSPRQQAMQIVVNKQGHAPLDPGPDFPEPVRALIAELTASDPAQRTLTAAQAWERLRAIEHPERGAGPAVARQLVALPPSLPAVTPAAPSAAPAPAPVRRWGPLLLLLGGLGLGVGSLVGALVAGGLWVGLGADRVPARAPSRPVEVVVQGVPEGVPVRVRVGELPAQANGFSHHVGELPVGPVQVRWALGEGCAPADCPGSACAPWCAHGTEDASIRPGQGPELVRLSLALPDPRPVRLLSPLAQVQARVGGLAGSREADALVWTLAPGRYPLQAWTGDCPEGAGACAATGDCPPGCSALARELVVPVGEGPVSLELGLDPAPVGLPAPVGVPAVTPGPRARSGGLVTVRQFAAFVAKDPRWGPHGASAPPGGEYLASWRDGLPPGEDPVVGISPGAAMSYCAAQGSTLAPIGPPLPAPDTLEYRLDGAEYVSVEADGTVAPLRYSFVSPFYRFRCAS